MTSAQLVILVAAAAGSLWALAKLGQGLTKLLEGAAAIAVVFLTAWLAAEALWRAGRWTVRHWRTTLTTAAVLAWWHWLGLVSLAAAVTLAAVGLAVW
jgi:DNA segregation ATPase FtsK/SpoIIIE, S-DNA-T family